jgi:hypothetical protein
MLKPSDIPVFGSILNTGFVFLKNCYLIVRRPLAFPTTIDFESRASLRTSLEFYVASIIICYIILLPAFLRYETNISQNLFVILQFARTMVAFSSTHMILKILNSKKPFKVTFILQNDLNGFFYSNFCVA